MELVEGWSLAGLLRVAAPLTPPRAPSSPAGSAASKVERIAREPRRWRRCWRGTGVWRRSPATLVLTLTRENRALGLRAVATADGLDDATLRQVLELTDDWQERRKVFEQIPELVGEPERALALVDRLRQSTRNGNDLFFLERTASEIGRRDPQAERLASRLRDRFFDHVPMPPAELFQGVDTPLDGRVALWRDIPAGSFLMGSPEGADFEKPQHPVEITKPFRMAAVPVTNAQYAAFDPDPAKDEPPDHPVRGVSWFAATAFCRWLSQALPETRGARLPTEEEWEYACRAGSQTKYWRGDTEADLARVGWYDKNSGNQTHPVGEKPANPWGLYDVHGNVWEWTLSPFTDEGYSGRDSGFKVDPSAVSVDEAADHAAAGGHPVYRGGSAWNDPDRTRAAYRNRDWIEIVHENDGLRVVLPPLPAAPSPRPRARGPRGTEQARPRRWTSCPAAFAVRSGRGEPGSSPNVRTCSVAGS